MSENLTENSIEAVELEDFSKNISDFIKFDNSLYQMLNSSKPGEEEDDDATGWSFPNSRDNCASGMELKMPKAEKTERQKRKEQKALDEVRREIANRSINEERIL